MRDELAEQMSITQSGAARVERIAGYDVARSIALLGMIVVHFSLVGAADRNRPTWLAEILSLLDGRAAATFVILAGIGITLMSQRAVASSDPSALAGVQQRLVRRGLFLLILGFVNLAIWPGDILRVYGVSLLLASRLLTAPGRRLLTLAAAFALGFVVLLLCVDFEKNWDWETLTYHHLWTVSGLVRNLFYDGFRSVVPWTGFILYGMWLGRLDLLDGSTNRRVLAVAVAVVFLAEGCSRVLVSYFLAHPHRGLDAETVEALFGTVSMPPLPLFLLSAGGAGTAVIAICVWAASRYPGPAWRPLSATGQMALTWYVAHIVIGLGALEALGVAGTKSLLVSAGYGLLFFAAAVLLSWAFKRVTRHGPLEWFMRRVAG
jgi:uncharacterized membrane protein YeiB